ncbi:hypothetical protein, partial [Bacillus thuringiensis]|uniref:hypothetical protein n=1 Tax=Bacillus thuringiensis TaxID=1428 RepID=UPI00333C9237
SMESYAFPGQDLSSQNWYGDYWATLSSITYEPIRVEQFGDGVRFLTNRTHYVDEVGIELPMYLGVNPYNPGVIISSSTSRESWSVTAAPTGMYPANYFAFKNSTNNQFMSARDSLNWLYVDKSTMDSKTMWRLVPQE